MVENTRNNGSGATGGNGGEEDNTPTPEQLGFTKLYGEYLEAIRNGKGIRGWKKPTPAQSKILDNNGIAPAAEIEERMEGGVPRKKE